MGKRERADPLRIIFPEGRYTIRNGGKQANFISQAGIQKVTKKTGKNLLKTT
jgi:hypothetical protein